MKNILIIDDNEDCINSLEELLLSVENFECKVIKAKDGFDGLMKIQNQTFDLIICDNQMPKKTGIDLVSDLILQKKYSPNKFILISGEFTKEEVSRVIELKISSVLAKPVDFNRLLEKVQLLLKS